MNNGIPTDFLSCLPLFTKRSNDWTWLYPLVNVLAEQRENLPPAESGKTDVNSDVYLYAAYVVEGAGLGEDEPTWTECQPVVCAGQAVDGHTMLGSSLRVHAKNWSDLGRFLDVVGQPFAHDLRRKIMFHATSEPAAKVLLAPMYAECLHDSVPTSYPVLIGLEEAKAPRLVNDVGPESWPRAWKLHDGSKPFEAWPDYSKGAPLDLRGWLWEPDVAEVPFKVNEVAWNAFLFLLRASEEQFDLRAVAESVEAASSADKRETANCSSIYVPAEDLRAFACVAQLGNLLVVSVFTGDSRAKTSSKKWRGPGEVSDLLKDCLQLFCFPPLPLVHADGRVERL